MYNLCPLSNTWVSIRSCWKSTVRALMPWLVPSMHLGRNTWECKVKPWIEEIRIGDDTYCSLLIPTLVLLLVTWSNLGTGDAAQVCMIFCLAICFEMGRKIQMIEQQSCALPPPGKCRCSFRVAFASVLSLFMIFVFRDPAAKSSWRWWRTSTTAAAPTRSTFDMICWCWV